MNTPLLLQTHDGLPLTELYYDPPLESPACPACEGRIGEGTEVFVHTYLEQKWELDSVYHADCLTEAEPKLKRDTEEVILTGRVATRSDVATQQHFPVLYTGKDYGILEYSEGTDAGGHIADFTAETDTERGRDS